MGQRTSTQVDKLAKAFKKGLNSKLPEAQNTTLEALLKDMPEVHDRLMTLFSESNAVSAASAKRTSTGEQEFNDDEQGQETDIEGEDESPLQRDMDTEELIRRSVNDGSENVNAASAKRTSTGEQEFNDDEQGQETDIEGEDESPLQRDMDTEELEVHYWVVQDHNLKHVSERPTLRDAQEEGIDHPRLRAIIRKNYNSCRIANIIRSSVMDSRH
ncbi:hypothetical protein SARC_09198 [Sphaeroforma arctica JP610]|uniref:Uncharacterized protein n=1 Tax=Sphaeroforma arctica JP610 TaxID=667725 RepID=A0A0L0FPD0_9EUKA|nr:hypothetical protein SARC_09198 [Sphaeroforma arctica JP610]KNC78376.1 hypothetical protein SARC_09198 [Sphaeroforma arctica JP610]|eukprot:XP_014152278.1 hypothetical protein SARC_09198 [Sphaeroforma arctica JP610]